MAPLNLCKKREFLQIESTYIVTPFPDNNYLAVPPGG